MVVGSTPAERTNPSSNPDTSAVAESVRSGLQIIRVVLNSLQHQQSPLRNRRSFMPETPSGPGNARRIRLFQWIFLIGAVVVVIVLAYRSPIGREFGIRCLGKLGPVSVPVLRRAMWDESFDVQAAAKIELVHLGEKALPSLTKSLGDSEPRIQIQSLHALAVLGPAGRGAVPAVIGFLEGKDADMRIQAINTLGVIGVKDPAAIAAVIRLMSDPEASVRSAAVTTLYNLDAGSDVALPALLPALKDPDNDVRFWVIVAFGKFKLRTETALSALQEISAGDPSAAVREEANEVLARLNPQGKSAAPASVTSSADFTSAGEAVGTEVAVRVGKISVATLRQEVNAFGTVEPEPGTKGKAPASAKISSPLSGIVAEVSCAEGQPVEKGQVLFTLDGRKLNARIDQARADLAAAEKNLNELEKTSKTDTAAQLLFAKTRQERDQARSNLDFALAQQALLKVTAPLSGTVVFVNVRPGEVVDPESPAALVEVVDLGRLIVSASMPATDLSGVKAGQTVEILPPQNAGGAQKTLTGQVMLVEDRVDPKTDMGTVDISLPAEAGLRSGQFVRVRIVTEEHRDCLAVPSESLVKNDGGEWVICLVRGKLAVQQPVAPGFRDAGMVEVQSPAIKAGDRVVTTGAAALPPKSFIRIIKD